MRFASIVLPLMAATTAFSGFTDVLLNISSNINISAIGDCKSAIDEYQECLINNISLDSVGSNVDNFCASFASEKCQNYYKVGVAGIPECQDVSKELIAPFQFLANMVYAVLSLGCSKDENGNYCPLAGKSIFNNNKLSMEELNVSLNETCKSKQCYDVATNSFLNAETSQLLVAFLFQKQLNNLNIDAIENTYLEKINQFLSSENCTIQHTPVEDSGATNTFIINSFLFICLSFLLFILF